MDADNACENFSATLAMKNSRKDFDKTCFVKIQEL